MRNFQRSRGIPADGYASSKLLERVELAAQGRETLGRDSVRLIQQRLNERGYNAGVPDGIAGPQTRSAIAAFQNASGFAPDGQPSPALLQSLNWSGSARFCGSTPSKREFRFRIRARCSNFAP